MLYSPKIDELINRLSCLPGVGPKTAQRMAFHLLERNREGGQQLAQALQTAMHDVQHCQRCRNFCETEECWICRHPRRRQDLLCIVETPADIIALENSQSYQGLYFVLMGHLSPIDGIGPNEIGIEHLKQRLANEAISEVIIATNSTVEGEATAHYIAELVHQQQITASRIAHGVPMGGELEYINQTTLAHALSARAKITPQ